MEKASMLKELQELVSKCTSSILYTPTKDELDYNDTLFPLKIPKNYLLIPKDKNSNPFEWADNSITKFKNTKVFILIPGTQFDTYGTRYGKGAGWYDRFLSKMPSAWLRIGIADKTQLSHSKLLRQKWDEPIDWLIIQDNSFWDIYKINART